MASLWAQERAQTVIDTWDEWSKLPRQNNLYRNKLKELIAEAIDAAEEYGEARFGDIQHESSEQDS